MAFSSWALPGLEGVHFHDLRHTGNQLSANAGANLRELMNRTGHDSTRAALIYLHSSADRHRVIADPNRQGRQEGTRQAFWHADGTRSGV
jgi:integrase